MSTTLRHDLRSRLDRLAAVGDWQGPVVDLIAAHERLDWYGQRLGRQGHRERWAFWAGVCQLGTEHGDPASARLVEVYTAAALYAPASQWWVIAGEHDEHDDPAYIDEETHPYLAGPFDTEEDAHEFIADTDPVEPVSVVPRRPLGCPS